MKKQLEQEKGIEMLEKIVELSKFGKFFLNCIDSPLLWNIINFKVHLGSFHNVKRDFQI